MNTTIAGRIVALLLVPLLLTSCDSAGESGAAEGGDRLISYKVDCYMPEGAGQPAFLATGAIEDEGLVEGPPLPWNPVYEEPQSWSGHRTLLGEKGNIRLFLDAERAEQGSVIARGRYFVLDGTGAYAGFQGTGEFLATVDHKGDLVEIFRGETDNNYR